MDKLLHFALSFVAGLIDPSLAFAAGVGKEVIDLFGTGTADILDLLADLAGIIVAGLFV